MANMDNNRQLIYQICGVILAVILIAILDVALSNGIDPATKKPIINPIAKFILGRGTGWFYITEQNIMIVVFGYAMSELLMRRNESAAEIEHLFKRYLPEDDQTMLQVADLGSIVRQVKQGGEYERRFLPRLIHRVALQFQSSRSVDQANSLLNSSLELFLHEIDLHYNILRYIMWLIPTLGFIGTVRGIAQALARAGATKPDNPDLLSIVTSELAVAFDTTLIALLLSGVLVMLVHIIQASEERNLNRAGNYCVDNLINRLYEN